MPTPHASKLALCAAALAVLAGCSTTNTQTPAAPAPVGTEAAFCPQISLREGTAIMRKGEGASQEYVASIAETTRSCRVVNGELVMEIGVAGRVMPGAGARAGTVSLPIRVAVTRGSEVLYSNLGRQSVQLTPGGGAQTFTYVDRGIRLPEPVNRSVTIFAGFDEQAR